MCCRCDVKCAEGATPAITLGHMLTPLPPLTAACSYDPRGLDPSLGACAACNRGLWAGARVINVPKMGKLLIIHVLVQLTLYDPDAH